MKKDNQDSGQQLCKVMFQNDYELFRIVFTLNPVAIFISSDNKFVYANKKALELVKAGSIEELRSLSTIDIVHPRYRNIVAGRRPLNICEEFSLAAVEVELLCMDKSVIDVEMESSVFAFRDSLFTLTTVREIDKKEKIKSNYPNHDVLINAVLDSTIDGILVVDEEGKIINVNNRFIEMWNMDEENFRELDELTVLKQILGRMEEREKIENIISKADSVVNEYYDNVRFIDGRVFNFYSCPLIVEGEIAGRIWNFRDVTVQAEAEEKLNRSNNELKETIEKLKETQARLIQQEKLAGIGQLAAGVAHEINNPLAYTISNLDTLKGRMELSKNIINRYRQIAENIESYSWQEIINELNQIKEMESKKNFEYIIEDIDELINDSIEGLKKAGHIVASLREFSGRYEADKCEDYNINEGIENTLTIMESEIKPYAIVERDLNPIPFIRANSGQINQIILNMIQNSIRAIKMKGGGAPGVIKLKTFAKDKHVIFEIEDDGIGIEKENINKIFLPFYTTKDVGEGCGLGLSAAYDMITNKHKGEITVESEPYQGTKFTIKLPI